MNTEIIDL